MAYIELVGWESGVVAETQGSAASGTVSVDSTTKRTGTYSLRINPTANASRLASGSITNTTLYVTCYLRVATAPSANDSQVFKYGSGVNMLAGVIMDTDRTLQITGATTSGATSALALNTWYRIDMKFVQNGTCELQVDGATAVTCTGNNNAPSFFYWGSRDAAVTYDLYYDDCAISDSAIPGAGQIFRMDPDGAGTHTAWTGTYTDVDEVPHDSDTTFISTSTDAVRESVTLESAAAAGLVGTPLVVKALAIARDTVGNTNFNVGMISGGTESLVATVTTTTYAGYGNVRNTDPNGGVAWTSSALDALEIVVYNGGTGFERRVSAMYAMVWEDGVAAGADPEIALIRGGKLVGGGLLLKGGLRG